MAGGTNTTRWLLVSRARAVDWCSPRRDQVACRPLCGLPAWLWLPLARLIVMIATDDE